MPGVGATLARKIAARGITEPEALELAAYDGTLDAIPGFGPQRVAAVRRALAARFEHPRRDTPLTPRPDVAMLLALDDEYRRRVSEGTLRRIAPRRFNPGQRAWLPVWRTQQRGWEHTIMYANTPQAFALGKRRDWVIIVYRRDGQDDACTIVTEHQGLLRGQRVIRGRERECADLARATRIRPEVRAWVHEMHMRS